MPDIKAVQFPLHNGSSEIVAIDGSYAPVYRISSLWLVAIRAVALTYEFSESQGYMIKECEVSEAAQIVTTDKDIAVEIDGFTTELQVLTAKRTTSEAPKSMAALARTFREYELATTVAQKSHGAIVVLDGSLTAPPIDAVKTKLDEVIDICRINGSSLVGVSKDSNLNLFGCRLTDEELLQYVKQEGPIYVTPPQPHKSSLGPKGTTYFVKFHPKAPKWFRTDVVSRLEPGELFGRLAQFARSQLCLGYIYPLAEAHKAAVELRKFPELYDGLLFRVAAEKGVDMAEAVWGRTNIDGRRRDAFHAYLDLISKSRARRK